MSESAALAGARAVITGASSGIGRAAARRLAALGAEVALVARRTDVLAREAAALGPCAVALPCDLADERAVAALADALQARWPGGATVLVNSAGLFPLAPVAETPPELFRATLDTNLVGPFLLLRALLPSMLARRAGHVVTVGSVADRHVFPENGAYAASKFGARALHEVLRAELRGSGVRATLVSPGPVDTPLWDAVDPDSRPGFTPRAAMLPAEAVAEAIAYVLTQPSRVNVDELRLSAA
ncbi:MAG TPA: SDR family oxidoreductase [Gemmatimonadaceae bacterium]|nr:SDR family oxidoreductase [Gemmatimonadaceae bacterium]